MKRAILILGLILFAAHTQAQTQADVQKAMKEAQQKLLQLKANPQYKAAMQKAQQAMQQLKSDTAVQKQMSEANTQLQAMKKDHPEMADVKIPDLNNLNAGVPNMDSLSASLSQQMNKAQKGMAAIKQFKEQFTPESNPLHKTESLATLKKASVSAFTQATLKNVSTTLGMVMKGKLDKVAKDSTLNVAGTGLFYLSLNFSPKEASAYLICKGILLHPADPYAINALGVYYRDNNDLEDALKLFLYADALLPDSIKSPYIYANIGWASFYYGDFKAAKEYFDKALAISSNFQPALEGNANLAYAEGDIKALFQCLAKELEASLASSPRGLGASGGGSEPSSGFVATCGGATGMDQESNPSDNHTFDNLGKENDSPEQDPPPGADVTYPSLFMPVFNVKDVKDDAAAYKQYAASAMPKALKKLNDLKEQRREINARFYSVSYFDEHGEMVHTRDYTKFSDLHGMISVLFERRVNQLIVNFNKKTLKPFGDNVLTSFENAQPILGACRTKKCLCQEDQRLYQDGNSLLASGSEAWSKLYDNIVKECRWYLKNDAPIVSRVHDPKCNKVLNLDREISVRNAILAAYECWAGILAPLTNYSGIAIATEGCPVYGVKMRGINAPAPFSKKPKHIKEFADPNCKDVDFPIGIAGSITENCHYTKISIGPKIGPIQLGFTYTTNKDLFTGKVKDKIYSKNNDFDHGYGATAGISYKFDEVVEVGVSAGGTVNYNDKGKATGYTGSAEAGVGVDFGIAKLGGKANTTWQMDADGNFTGHSNSITGNASVANQKSSTEVGGDYTSTSNYDANGNYIGGSNTAKISVDQSGSTNIGGSKVESKSSYFGVQVNQVIQVVAGANRVTPFTVK